MTNSPFNPEKLAAYLIPSIDRSRQQAIQNVIDSIKSQMNEHVERVLKKLVEAGQTPDDFVVCYLRGQGVDIRHIASGVVIATARYTFNHDEVMLSFTSIYDVDKPGSV